MYCSKCWHHYANNDIGVRSYFSGAGRLYPYLESGVELDQSSGRSSVTHLRLVFMEQEAASASHGRGLLNSPQICVICSDCV